jgi:hypothetical protein
VPACETMNKRIGDVVTAGPRMAFSSRPP